MTCQFLVWIFTRDHPCEYGENFQISTVLMEFKGSSPRIRGKSAMHSQTRHMSGIIPANTGKMRISVRCVMVSRDHPREYGENGTVVQTGAASGGSSPRIRGKWWRSQRGWPLVGIIPANTGKIICIGTGIPVSRDHPREYGENGAGFDENILPKGSSPRIRGKCHLWWPGDIAPGIIPANTGKIPYPRAHPTGYWDHPREYGEN